MNEYPVKRDADGILQENCTIAEFKVGSFDCTANCKHNENTKKEIHTHGFEIPFVRCQEINKKNSQQLIFEI